MLPVPSLVADTAAALGTPRARRPRRVWRTMSRRLKAAAYRGLSGVNVTLASDSSRTSHHVQLIARAETGGTRSARPLLALTAGALAAAMGLSHSARAAALANNALRLATRFVLAAAKPSLRIGLASPSMSRADFRLFRSVLRPSGLAFVGPDGSVVADVGHLKGQQAITAVLAAWSQLEEAGEHLHSLAAEARRLLEDPDATPAGRPDVPVGGVADLTRQAHGARTKARRLRAIKRRRVKRLVSLFKSRTWPLRPSAWAVLGCWVCGSLGTLAAYAGRAGAGTASWRWPGLSQASPRWLGGWEVHTEAPRSCQPRPPWPLAWLSGPSALAGAGCPWLRSSGRWPSASLGGASTPAWVRCRGC